MSSDEIIRYLLTGLAALFAIMFHEISHGYVAYKLGDMTAKEHGRLSLNPLRHVDWFGLIMLIVAGFGWAKPVPVDMRYFQKPRRDMALVSLAGPVMNFILAFISMLVYTIITFFYSWNVFAQFFLISMLINIGLGIFNLFPIPPLDGSKMLGIVLPEHIHMQILRHERYGMIALMILLWTGLLDKPLGFLRDTVGESYLQIGNQLYKLLAQMFGR